MGKDEYLEISENSKKLILPSDREKIYTILEKNKLKKQIKLEKRIKFFKLSLFIILVLILYLSYNSVIFYILDFVRNNFILNVIYEFIQTQIREKTILGLFLISVFSSVFFLTLPSEAVFIYYLSTNIYNPFLIVLFLLVGNMLGLTFNYYFGKFTGEKFLKWVFKKKFYVYKEKVNNYGGYVILFGNIIPGPIEPISVFFGSFRFKFSTFIFLSFMGRLIKFIILFFLFFFFWDSVLNLYNELLDNFLILKDLFRFR